MSADLPEAAIEAAEAAAMEVFDHAEDPIETFDLACQIARAALAAALPHLATVQPNRDDLHQMFARHWWSTQTGETERWEELTADEQANVIENTYGDVFADAMLAATPGRTVAEVKAEALREVARAWIGATGLIRTPTSGGDFDPVDALRARAGRIEAGETR